MGEALYNWSVWVINFVNVVTSKGCPKNLLIICRYFNGDWVYKQDLIVASKIGYRWKLSYANSLPPSLSYPKSKDAIAKSKSKEALKT